MKSEVLYIPDGASPRSAFERVTHLGIGAHADDLEFMALHGILACHATAEQWFGGIVCTDGAGSPRSGSFANYSTEELIATRQTEQRQAASLGRYSFVAQLGHPSALVAQPEKSPLEEELFELLQATRPRIVYAHNPADKHLTHLAVFAATLRALRRLPRDNQPEQFIGCEVWRGLDWAPDHRKVVMDVSGQAELAAQLCAVFRSQIAGGKRYDLALKGRRVANATFQDSRHADACQELIYGLDLLPLLRDPTLSPKTFLSQLVDELKSETLGLLERVAP